MKKQIIYLSSVIETLKYFKYFNYPPTEDELYVFNKKKSPFDRFKSVLEKMVKEGVITRIFNSQFSISNKFPIFNFQNEKNQKQVRYTLPEYGIKKYQISNIKNQRLKNSNETMEQWNNFNKRYETSKNKLSSLKFEFYIKLLSLFPQIKLVGLSGSMAMMNADEDDDVDLFIITAKNRLFTGRFITLILAQLLNLRRRRDVSPSKVKRIAFASSLKYKNKICLNLFFDESALAVPKFKRSEYVAHEVLQMKPIVNKSQSHERFIRANEWVQKIFPNTAWINSKFKVQNSKLQSKIQNFKLLTATFHFSLLIFNLIGGWIEFILKKFQLTFINRHRTSEIITKHQLWFHPEDFGKKLPFNLKRQEGKDSGGDKN